MNIDLTVKSLKDVYKKKGYKFFENGDYNLNIFGIRANPGKVNEFDDYIGICWKIEDKWYLAVFPATTDPGFYYLKNPMNVNGTAILQEGQHIGAFKLGLHQGKYKALVQNKPLPLYRDINRDGKHDLKKDTLRCEFAGINIHHASYTGSSVQVDKWSAGCQVISSIMDWYAFIDIVSKACEIYGDVFTYTLFNEKDFQ